MDPPLVWITGASSGLGKALADAVPWADAQVIGISRRAGSRETDLSLDLSDPAAWDLVGASFREHLSEYHGEQVVFIHSAADVGPVRFAGDAPPSEYLRSVLLNSAAPQILGALFLDATRAVAARRSLVLVTSPGAGAIIPGGAAYIAGKSAINQWVKVAGAEQASRSDVQVLAVNPGNLDTPMQKILRDSNPTDLPSHEMFVDLWRRGQLRDPVVVAQRIWLVLERETPNGSVVDVNADLP